MNFIYNLVIKAYRGGIKIAANRNEKARKLAAGQHDAFAILESKKDELNGCVWIHAASLGEFEQGRPLIEKLRRANPAERILLTFFSPSGYEIRKNYGEVTAVCYLPMDEEASVKRFLDLVQPRMAIFVKYEFWGNYLEQLKARNVPTYIISSIFRPGQIFFRPWGGMFRKMLGCFNTLFVQNEESKQLLSTIGVNNVVVAGDTRFDRVTDIQASCKRFPILDCFTEAHDRPLLMMGSSWEPDEDIVIPYFNAHPGMKLVIAPHEFDDDRVKAMMAKIERPVARYTQVTNPEDVKNYDCLIIDCFGILSSCYAYAQAAYIGGGFGVGIHNLNEAAVYGIPVIFGPNHYKFKEASDLIACGGGYSIGSPKEFAPIFDKFLTDADALAESGAAAGRYIKSQLGATEKIYKAIF